MVGVAPMAEKPLQRLRRFLAELKRRKACRVGAVCAGVAFVSLQAALMLASLILVACGATQDTPTKFERVEIDVGRDPHVLAAELTGDGRPDLAVAGEGRVLILTGDGDGGFRRAGEYEAGEDPTGLAASDLDSDGDLDLAVANHETDYLTLLLNDGGGAFGPAQASPVRIEVTPHPHTVAAGDLDRDGRTELLVDHRSAGGLLTLYGNDQGDFEPGEVVVLGGDPYRDVVVADLDGDGVLDLATPNERTVGFRLGRLGGGFGELRELDASRVAPYGLAAGDVNGDGVPDLAASSGEGGEGAVVLLGDGSGSFRPAPGSPYAAARGFSALDVADLDGDGRDDLAVTSWDAGEVAILYGRDVDGGDGRAPVVRRVELGEGPWSVSAADFDADGRDDLAVAVTGESRVVVLLSRGAAGIEPDRWPEDQPE